MSGVSGQNSNNNNKEKCNIVVKNDFGDRKIKAFYSLEKKNLELLRSTTTEKTTTAYIQSPRQKKTKVMPTTKNRNSKRKCKMHFTF